MTGVDNFPPDTQQIPYHPHSNHEPYCKVCTVHTGVWTMWNLLHGLDFRRELYEFLMVEQNWH